jgi:hypothetical protein
MHIHAAPSFADGFFLLSWVLIFACVYGTA